MRFDGIELVCPACRSDLAAGDEVLRCATCSREYPVVLGIPDLRLWPDPYIGMEEDRAKARMLAEECRDLDFAASVEFYYRVTAAVPPFQARRFARSLLAAITRSEALLAETRRSGGAGGDLLDVGCGTAPLMVAAARSHRGVAGVDIAFRWLVLARKRLDEAGLAAPLVCACAEALPFRDASFDRIVAESTVEHLRDQMTGVRECARVLRPGAAIVVSTPNRHSLGPDPHTGLPAGGWLPDAVTAAYVRRKGGVPPRRRLLSAGGVSRLLRDCGFVDVAIAAPTITDAQRASFSGLARAGVDAYRLARRVPGGGAALRVLGPLLHATARMPGAQ